jgi:hypothetical protein
MSNESNAGNKKIYSWLLFQGYKLWGFTNNGHKNSIVVLSISMVCRISVPGSWRKQVHIKWPTFSQCFLDKSIRRTSLNICGSTALALQNTSLESRETQKCRLASKPPTSRHCASFCRRKEPCNQHARRMKERPFKTNHSPSLLSCSHFNLHNQYM